MECMQACQVDNSCLALMPLGQHILAQWMLRGGEEVEENFSGYDLSIRSMFSQKPLHFIILHYSSRQSTAENGVYHHPQNLWVMITLISAQPSVTYELLCTLIILATGLLAGCIMSPKRNMNLPDDLFIFGAAFSYQRSALFDPSALRYLAWARRSTSDIFSTAPLTLDVNPRGPCQFASLITDVIRNCVTAPVDDFTCRPVRTEPQRK